MLIRRTLEHELVQLIGAVTLQVEICLQVERKRADDLRPELLRLRELTSEAVRGLRRTLLELAPSLLEEIGLVETLRRYLRELARVSRLERVAVTGPEQNARLAPPLSHLVYRLLQELAVRVARQPGVTELAVELRLESAQLVAVREAGGPAALDPLPPLDPLVTERLEQLGASLAEEAIAAERWRGTLLVPLT